MKNNLLVLTASVLLLGSCGIFGRSQKNGCPAGRNVGAEKVLANDPVALKTVKKINKKNKQAKDFYN